MIWYFLVGWAVLTLVAVIPVANLLRASKENSDD